MPDVEDITSDLESLLTRVGRKLVDQTTQLALNAEEIAHLRVLLGQEEHAHAAAVWELGETQRALAECRQERERLSAELADLRWEYPTRR